MHAGMVFLFSSCRGSSLSTMRTGERHWSVRAAQFFVCWTLKGTTSLYWKECLKISHLDRLEQTVLLYIFFVFHGFDGAQYIFYMLIFSWCCLCHCVPRLFGLQVTQVWCLWAGAMSLSDLD